MIHMAIYGTYMAIYVPCMAHIWTIYGTWGFEHLGVFLKLSHHPLILPTNHVVENRHLCYYFVIYVMGGWITVHNCYKYNNFDGR